MRLRGAKRRPAQRGVDTMRETRREGRRRREFLEASVLAGGCLALCPLLARAGEGETAARDERERYVFDETMAYCCAECTPEKCAFLSHDPEIKRQKALELSQKLGREITPEQVTCSRCRVAEEQAFPGIQGCPIRKCVLEKKVLSCAHCEELTTCTRANHLTLERALTIQRVVLGSPTRG
jgi:hypothetical protein